ncbi:fused MFS/spermidine synthase [Polaromonas sp.]|uniref:fused MFS/spermidine synthase n=1 Tax=Polaromonas sp. TaxID=1869339 RepID=UPI0013B91B19|nr:fused MFS/spermidine synthase [Polaromonas sp.]NDP62203.1 glycosyl transferase [Polaromonas sp.]
MTAYKFFVYVLAGWSGFFVMALELLGGRALGPFFGTGIYVWGAIITLFMLSLSIGYLIGGALSARRPSLEKLSAILLLAVLTSLPCVLASNPILEFIFDRVPDPRYGALSASVALFFLPITVSGAVSPYAVRLLVEGLGTSGKVAGNVFFVSTFGSMLGTLLTSFYLVLLFELDQILWGMMTISFLIGAAGLVFHRGRTPHVATA